MKAPIAPEQKQAILTAYAAGTPIKEICSHFGVSNGTVFRFTTEASIIRPKNVISAEIRVQLIEAYLRGDSIQKVAKDFGTRPNTVSNILSNANVKRPLNTVDAARRKVIVDAYAGGQSTLDVANRFQVNSSTVLKFVKEAGVKVRNEKGAVDSKSKLIATLYAEGKSLQEIAESTGFAVTTVYKLLQRSDVPLRSMSEIISATWLKPQYRVNVLANRPLQLTGENSRLWQGGKTKLRELLRSTARYKEWRGRIFQRDNRICQHCEANGRKTAIEADHIYPFCALLANHNIQTREQGIECEALWDIANGRTLCKACHEKTDTYKQGAKKYLKF